MKPHQYILGAIFFTLGATSYGLSNKSTIIYYTPQNAVGVVEIIQPKPTLIAVSPTKFSTNTAEPPKILKKPKENVVVPVTRQETTPLKKKVLETEPKNPALANLTKDKIPVFTVPFYSQFTDITSKEWKKVGCGITSLAMIIDFYTPEKIVVDNLLNEGIKAGAYLDRDGWTYAGLLGVSKEHGVKGSAHDLSGSSMKNAFSELSKAVKKGPVMVSVHYTFEPTNPIPHLVVMSGISNGMVYFNDPASNKAQGSITVDKFQKSWKKRYLDFHKIS